MGVGPVELGTKNKGQQCAELCKRSETSALISHLPFFCFPDLISSILTKNRAYLGEAENEGNKGECILFHNLSDRGENSRWT